MANRLENAIFGTGIRQVPALLPGIGAALAIVLAATWLAKVGGRWLLAMQGVDPAGKASPISGISIAIILGVVLANTVGVSRLFQPGLDFAIRKALRLGIILVGVKLSVLDIVKLGGWGVPLVLTVIASALALTSWFARRLKVSDNLATLTAAATAICGVTATVATAPVIEADDREVAYTVANVTLFGMLAMLTYPYVAHLIFPLSPVSAGMFLGTAIHDTSQVMAAGLSYREVYGDELAFRIATITKLTRNVMIVAVVPLLGYLHAKKSGTRRKVTIAKLFPFFVAGFVLMAVFRSTGDALLGEGGRAFGVWSGTEWASLTKLLGETISYWALGAAMAGVGLTTRMKVIRQLGLRPLYLGASVALLVGTLAILLSALLGPLVRV